MERTPHKNKIKLALNSPEKAESLDLDQNLVWQAANKSYLRHISDAPEVSSDELVTNVTSFIMDTLLKKEENVDHQLQEQWFIVAMDEGLLDGNISEDSKCGNFDTSKGMKLYQLFISLAGKELRFQSLQNSKKKFIVNVDTVALEEEEIFVKGNYKQANKVFRLVVDKKYHLHFCINEDTLPFQLTYSLTKNQVDAVIHEENRKVEQRIRKAVQEGKAHKLSFSSKLLNNPEFFNERYATESQFAKYCQTGDVILFKDNHTMAKVQRFLTNSDCDHIAVVFKDEKYRLCLFESNSGTGVSLIIWTQFIRYKWWENIEAISWRRLNMMNKPKDFEENFKKFVKVNLHKEYGLSLSKLVRFKEVVYENPKDEKSRTFFCSELVAALYKYLKVLDQEKPSSRYYPKDFTDEGSLNMINCSALEPQRKLIFNEKLLKQNYRFLK